MKNLFIDDSHRRCLEYRNHRHISEQKTFSVTKEDEELVQAVGECLKKIKSTFFALFNSYFIVTNKDLAVLNCFVNKNANVDVKPFVPPVGTVLTEEKSGTNAFAFAKLKSDVGYVTRGEHYKSEFKKLTCAAAPIKIKQEIAGYVGVCTLNKADINGLRVFIESLTLNVSECICRKRLRSKMEKYLRCHDIDINAIDRMDNLSEKERQVLEYMLKAHSYDQIAEKLYISEATVRTYVKRVSEKCGTKNRLDTVIFMLCYEILRGTL